jgi:hypothetical protein
MDLPLVPYSTISPYMAEDRDSKPLESCDNASAL